PYGPYGRAKRAGQGGALPTPPDRRAQAATALADAAVKPQNSTGAPAGTPVVAPDGGASQQIKHVFYIVKENRTYDQLFGSDARGDGDPALELFDDNGVPGPTGGVKPTAPAAERPLPLIEPLYADYQVSGVRPLITSVRVPRAH